MRFTSDSLLRSVLIIFALFATALGTGCSRKIGPADLHATPWVIADVSFEREKTNAFSSQKTPEAQGGFFRFYPDGRATASRNGEMLIGDWSFDPAQSSVRLQYGEGKSEAYRVSRSLPGTLVFKTDVGNTAVTYTLTSDDFDYADRDIYSPAMNAWRVPARAEHTEEELQQRLLGMLTFLEAYFEAAAIQSLDSVEISSLPTPYLFAANGVAVYRPDRLPTKWILLFARREESEYAASILGGLFRDATMPQVSNRLERNAQIFTQLRIIYQRQIDNAAKQTAATH